MSALAHKSYIETSWDSCNNRFRRESANDEKMPSSEKLFKISLKKKKMLIEDVLFSFNKKKKKN